MALLGGCTLFPADGPQLGEARNGAALQASFEEPRLQYAFVDMTPSISTALEKAGGFQFSGFFTDRRPPTEIRLGVGDVVAVTIFESAAGGLFIPSDAGVRPGNFVQLPEQQVDKLGNITVPYAGAVPASGRRIPDIQRAIEERLRRRAIEPQVVITLRDQRSQRFSVLGDVNTPLQLPLNPAGDRILDALARAGGPSGQGYDTFVTLQRRGQKATVTFDRLVSEPANNIYVQPGDALYVSRHARTYTALGATGQQALIKFESETLSLAEALGKAGGALDDRADPGAVFLYRQEPIAFLRSVGVDVRQWEGLKSVPVIYGFNTRDATGFFLASKTFMRDKDVMYISNAPYVEYTKAFDVLRSHAGAAATAATIATGAAY